jgi:hypothetical protein
VDALSIVKNPFGQGRFTRIDMSTDTDISDVCDNFLHCQFTFSLYARFSTNEQLGPPMISVLVGPLKNPTSEGNEPDGDSTIL